jgi:integrase/recombinase XerD
MCDQNAVTENPAKGVARPAEASRATDAISDAQARDLLGAPVGDGIKAKRDRAILATFLFHAVRRDELVRLKVRDLHSVRGVPHLRIHGKGDKIRDIPASPLTVSLIDDYLAVVGHALDKGGPLFRPLRNRSTGTLDKPLSPWSVWDMVKGYARGVGLEQAIDNFCVHSLRATAITNALDHAADMARVQEWVGHARIDTTRGYDRRKSRIEDSPTYRVRY